MVETVSDYINFCVQSIVKTKTVTAYANNKPWLTSDLKKCLHEKKMAHINGDELTKKEKQKEFERLKWVEKQKYKNKTEQKFTKGNMREAWQGLNTMMGKSEQQVGPRLPDTEDPVNDLNKFYARFDVRDFRFECDSFCANLEIPEELQITEREVQNVFKKLKSNKAPGPDQVQGKVVKSCFKQLSTVFTKVFQILINLHIMPKSWKTSTIIPLPKNNKAPALNDFRPVALTSILAKCFETVICQHLRKEVMIKLDPL